MTGGGGQLILQGPGCPTAILTALEDMAVAEADELRIAVAYTSLTGCRELMPRLAARIGEQRWSEIPKVVITSRDFGLTEPKAIEYLRSEHAVDVRFSEVPLSFHPKLYAFRSPAGVEVMVGSANLTRAALTANTEAATVLALGPDPTAFDATWEELLGNSIAVDDELLATYAAGWSKRPPVVVPDLPVVAPPAGDGKLPLFADAVRAGDVDPMAFDAFWVDVRSVSGKSDTQLELPREGHRFFGIQDDGYDAAHRTMGRPVLFSGGRVWGDRKLTWHGRNNQMARMNLPSRKQDGFDYAQSVILFKRFESRYQLVVAPQGSDVAASWRAASRRAGNEYRLGKVSPRYCGLF